ncbi:hypothetical protein B0T20DRAFT_329758, partial [Sordaria brevicollis]
MTNTNPDQIPLDDDTMDHNPDNDTYDPEAEAAAMAAAMGFSSFGQQPTLADSDETENADPSSGRPAKKRRYNSRVDAYVGPTPQGTGANDVPVQRRVFNNNAPAEPRGDNNEIQLDDNEINLDHDTEEGAAAGTTTLPTNPSLPLKPHFTLPANPGLPPKPEPQHFLVSGQQQDLDSQNDQHQNHGGHGRDPSQPWYTDYYDPSFNENPWERLEQQRGMESVGKWLPTPDRSGGGNRGGRGGPGGRGGRGG